jgi:hypothetical protein
VPSLFVVFGNQFKVIADTPSILNVQGNSVVFKLFAELGTSYHLAFLFFFLKQPMVGFKLKILLPRPPQCWDSNSEPLHLATLLFLMIA